VLGQLDRLAIGLDRFRLTPRVDEGPGTIALRDGQANVVAELAVEADGFVHVDERLLRVALGLGDRAELPQRFGLLVQRPALAREVERSQERLSGIGRLATNT